MTHYIVLRKQGDGNRWSIIGHNEASGPQQARKAIDPSEGEFLVVPVRNATFISGTTEVPEPRAVSVEVSAETYLDVQETLPTDPDHAGPTGDVEPEPAPVAA